MTQSPPDTNQPIRPVPIVQVEASRAVAPPLASEEPDAGTHGFTLSADTAEVAGLPPERRPLTVHAIRAWTVASLVGSLSFATIVAVVHSRPGAASDRTDPLQNAPALATQPPSARTDFVPSEPSASAVPPVIPLSALPKVGAETAGHAGHSSVTRQNHKAAAHAARTPAAVPVKKKSASTP
jgi:hypothetical protein